MAAWEAPRSGMVPRRHDGFTQAPSGFMTLARQPVAPRTGGLTREGYSASRFQRGDSVVKIRGGQGADDHNFPIDGHGVVIEMHPSGNVLVRVASHIKGKKWEAMQNLMQLLGGSRL